MDDQPRFASWTSPREDYTVASITADNEIPSFSARSLEDYLACQRRYQLTFIEKLKWPGAVSEPMSVYEAHLKAGQDFHRLVQRHQSGIPMDSLEPDDPLLARWWHSYLNHFPGDFPIRRMPELQISGHLDGFRLSARFDLLAFDERSAVIVDWKTSSYRPKRDTLRKKMQSRIYPLLMAITGKTLTGNSYSDEQISLIYWFTETPESPEVFRFSAKQMADDRDFLLSLMTEISRRDPGIPWPLTTDQKKCAYCTFRSFCDRGGPAGSVDEMDETVDDALYLIDLDTLDEIAY